MPLDTAAPDPATPSIVGSRSWLSGRSEGLLVVVGLLVCTLWANWLQERNAGKAWDGGAYTRMATHLALGLDEPLGEVEPYAAAFPFRNRIGLPLMTAAVVRVTGWDVVNAMRVVNTVVAILALLLFWLWLRYVLASPAYRVLTVGLWAVHWYSPIRYVAWYSTITDQLLLCGICGALLGYALLQRAHWAAWVVLPVSLGLAVLAREVGLLLLVGFLPFALSARSWGVGALSAAAVTFVAALVLHLTDVTPAQAVGQYEAYRQSIPHVDWWIHVLQFAVAFGPIQLCVLAAPQAVARQWWQHRYVPVVLLAMTPVWAWGWGEERYVSWLAPLVYPAIGVALAELSLWRYRAWGLALFLLVTQSVAARVWWAVPFCCANERAVLPVASPQCAAFPHTIEKPIHFLLTPWSGRCSMWNDLGVWFTSDQVRALLFEQYCVVAAVFACLVGVYWLRRLRSPIAIAEPGY